MEKAFRFLGMTPSHREIEIAADLLRDSGTEVPFNETVVALARAVGSSGIDALDLHVARYRGVEALRRGSPR